MISGFDPVRREIARVALLKLVSDGRIHPARIEEVVAKATVEVEEGIVAADVAGKPLLLWTMNGHPLGCT